MSEVQLCIEFCHWIARPVKMCSSPPSHFLTFLNFPINDVCFLGMFVRSAMRDERDFERITKLFVSKYRLNQDKRRGDGVGAHSSLLEMRKRYLTFGKKDFLALKHYPGSSLNHFNFELIMNMYYTISLLKDQEHVEIFPSITIYTIPSNRHDTILSGEQQQRAPVSNEQTRVERIILCKTVQRAEQKISFNSSASGKM